MGTPNESTRSLPSSSVLEVAVLKVREGESARFEAAFRQAQRIIASMPGYEDHELRRCVEHADQYLLLVWWDSIESHTEGFRQSAEYGEWKALLHHFYDPFPVVEHYVPIDGLAGYRRERLVTRNLITRLGVACVAAFAAFTFGWVFVGMSNRGDAFPQGAARFIWPLPFALAPGAGYLAFGRGDARGVRIVLGIAACLALAFWLFVSDGWWALGPPPPMPVP